MSALKTVIIGNGIAGVMVSARLRELEPSEDRLEIDVYTREPHEYYSRIRLPEVFSSKLLARDLEIYKPEWYQSRRIRVHKNSEVRRIDRGNKRILLEGGGEVPYDRLVLCMGAESYKPSIANSDLEGIFTVREYGDADGIRRHVTAGTRRAAVIGGGLLGLEAARHLMAPGVENVTIVEILPRLLPKQLDEKGSMLLRRIMEGPGCTIELGAKVSSFLGEKKVRGLKLEDGRELPAQTVLISSGISPRSRLAREAGLAVNKGVVVDERLRTSDPDIFAAGDLAEYRGVVWGIIPAAIEHATVVAANLLDRGPVQYRQTVPQNTLKVAGVSLTSIGKVIIEKQEEKDYEVVDRLDERRMRYEKYVIREGILEGCILLGSRDNYAFAVQEVGKAVTVERILALPW